MFSDELILYADDTVTIVSTKDGWKNKERERK